MSDDTSTLFYVGMTAFFIVGMTSILIVGFFPLNVPAFTEQYIVGTWESIDDDTMHVIFYSDGTGYITDGDIFKFLWKQSTGELQDYYYYTLYVSTMTDPQVCYLYYRNTHILYYGDQIYQKMGSYK